MKDLKIHCDSLIDFFKRNGVRCEFDREIPYGLNYKLIKNDNKFSLSIYQSKKKGISYVFNNESFNNLENIIKFLNCSDISSPSNQVIKTASMQHYHNWNYWMGTDESGKGDFYGPLVVAGFVVNDINKNKLVDLGIKDSKQLNPKKIDQIGNELIYNFSDYFKVLTVRNEDYNKIYRKFIYKDKKLNDILAWLHASVIKDLLKKHPRINGIIVDKFEKRNLLSDYISLLNGLSIIQAEKAESDLAVACASIVARYYLNIEFDNLSKKYDLIIPKGSSSVVKLFAKTFIKKWGLENFSKICKNHFKTYSEILKELKNNG